VNPAIDSIFNDAAGVEIAGVEGYYRIGFDSVSPPTSLEKGEKSGCPIWYVNKKEIHR
jgi:hypothetical protein